MAINVPMPSLPGDALLKGMDSGSSMFTRMMQPIIEREKQKQLEAHFQEQLKLSKAAAGRAAQAAADAHKKMDPMYEINQYQALENWIKGQQGGQQAAQPEMPIQTPPNQEMGEGIGMFTPQGMQDAQQAPQAPQVASPAAGGQMGGLNMELLKAHPMLRGFAKKHLGFDPLAGESNVLHGPARDAADLAKLKSQVGENSEVYQNAKAAYDAQVDAKKDLRDLRARTKAGLKPGEKEFFNEETGEPLGKEIPLTAAERQSEEGNILFNEFYPYVYKGGAPFSGEGSIGRLQQAAANYKTDPKARQMFEDLLLSDKMLAATIVNEASTLKAGKQNRTYGMLKESLESSDIPRVIKKLIKEYNIPASAQLKASMRYQKILSDARQKARKGTPATQKLFYNPEQQAQQEQQFNEGDPVSGDKDVIVIDPSGKRFKTTEANAAHLPKGWSRG